MAGSSKPKGATNRISTLYDREIGKQIRHLRMAADISQSELGRVLGVSFQQVQKYESGTNRLSAGALFQVATLFGVPIELFYRTLSAQLSVKPETARERDVAVEFARSPEGQRFCVAYLKCENPALKKIALQLLHLSEI